MARSEPDAGELLVRACVASLVAIPVRLTLPEHPRGAWCSSSPGWQRSRRASARRH